jgi:16S rRNA (cytosine967-C5)-methyltransferase
VNTASAARDFAVLSLDARTLPGLPRQAFKKKSAVRPRDPRDAALGEMIVAGVIKNLILLDHMVAVYAKRPLDQIDPKARLILLVALYQIRFLDRVPSRAAVNEAVQQTRHLGIPRTASFVNAMLRNALRKPPLELPPRSDGIAFAEVVLSHPSNCFTRLRKVMGERDALRCCRRNNRVPPMLVRLNRGKTIDDLRAAVESDVAFNAHEQAGIVVATGAKTADFARIAAAGVGQVQDATSAAIAAHIDAASGQAVLDRCCGVGTKTLQLLDLYPEAKITAVDSHGKRVNTLKRLIAERQVENVAAARVEWLKESPLAGRVFDRILIDAPCSNSGVLARRPEARYHQSSDEVKSVIDLQQEILADTIPALAPGGRLIYSTCSVWPEENEGQIDQLLAAHPDLRLAHQASTLPSLTRDPTKYRDGGYVAVVERNG